MQPLEIANPSPNPIDGPKDRLFKPSPVMVCSEQEVLRALRSRIRQAAQQGNFKRAITILNHLIQRYPDCVEYYSNRGLMYYYCRQWQRAMADYNQALTLDPNADRVYNNRANCLAAQGLWLDAIADYDRAIDLNPFNIQARINQGTTFRDIKQYEDALACFDIALFFGASQALIYAERGRTYYLQGHWNCAMGDYQRALTELSADQNNDNKTLEALKRRLSRWINDLLMLSA